MKFGWFAYHSVFSRWLQYWSKTYNFNPKFTSLASSEGATRRRKSLPPSCRHKAPITSCGNRRSWSRVLICSPVRLAKLHGTDSV